MKSCGYKGMLRDRVPKVVDYALKWKKAKEHWIDHAYVNFIKFYCDNNEKKHATRIVLGIAKFYRNFDFDKSIDWENLISEDKDPEDINPNTDKYYWERESTWKTISAFVKFFMKRYAYMENAYKNSRNAGKDDFRIKVEIINGYLTAFLPTEDMSDEEKQEKYKYVDKLVDFLFKCFENKV